MLDQTVAFLAKRDGIDKVGRSLCTAAVADPRRALHHTSQQQRSLSGQPSSSDYSPCGLTGGAGAAETAASRAPLLPHNRRRPGGGCRGRRLEACHFTSTQGVACIAYCPLLFPPTAALKAHLLHKNFSINPP